MKPSHKVLLKAFLKAYSKEDLIRFLPENLQKDLKSLTQITPFSLSDFSIENLFSKVHYSWFIPTLKSYEEDIPFFLAALPKEVSEPLQKILDMTPSSFISEKGAFFLKTHLGKSILEEKEEFLPSEYISPSFFSYLLGFSKQKLIKLIDYLSLYDLAYEIKHTVDTALLKKMNQYLTPPLKTFLQKIMPQTEGERLSLQNWDGTKKSFYLLLHKKGLKKLAALLQKEEKALIWHVAHTLDIGRGSSLLKLCEKRVTANHMPAIMRGIEELLKQIAHEKT